MEKEIIKDNEKVLSVSISASRVDSIKISDITKTGMRVYENGYIGVSGALGDIDENELAKKAAENLENKIPYSYELSSNLKKEVNVKKPIIDESKFMDECEAVVEALKNKYSNFSYFNKIKYIEKNVSMKNTKGLSLKHSENAVEFGICFKEKSSLNIFDGFVGCAGRSYNREDFINYAGRTLENYNNEVSLPKNGVYPVAFSALDDGTILGKFSSDLNGTIFGAGGSLFSGKTGQKLFADDFTLWQTHNPEDTFYTPFFDTEGTVNDDLRFALIENGVMKSPFTDKRTAKEYGLKNTGNAAGGYDDVPTLKRAALETSNLALKPGKKTIEQLFGGDMGILVVVTSGGFNASGDFGTPVQLAFLFDGKKIIGRLPQLSVSSNVYKMFGDNFRGVSSDCTFKHSNERLFVADMDVTAI